MAQKVDPKAQQSTPNRVYEDFKPPFDWASEQGSDTLIVSLEGFRKEQLRVQVTSSRLLRVSGERQIDEKRWRRFYLELPVPSDSDTNEIAAKFERGILYIKFSKLILPSNKPQTTSSEVVEAPKPPSSVPAPPPPPPPPSSQKSAPSKREEDKAEEEAMKKKAETEKEKDVSEGKRLGDEQGRGEAKASEGEEKKDVYERKASPNYLSKSDKNYKDAIVGLIGEVKKQKKIANLVMAILMVLLFVLYVKNSITSSLGGSKITHQDL